MNYIDNKSYIDFVYKKIANYVINAVHCEL